MSKAAQVEVYVAIRHRDADGNIVGAPARGEYVVDLKQFEKFAKTLKPTGPAAPKYTGLKKKGAMLNKVLRTVKEMVEG